MRLRQVCLLPILTFAVTTFSQQLAPPDRLDSAATTTHVHSSPTTAPNVVDGKVHPELIPDSAAFRLYFVVVGKSASASEAQIATQKSHMKKLSLANDDEQNAITIIDSFKAQYDDLIKRYNDNVQVVTSQGGVPDYSAFLSQREALVQLTKDRLKQTLSAEGFNHLDIVVQHEKTNMKVVVPSAAQ